MKASELLVQIPSLASTSKDTWPQLELAAIAELDYPMPHSLYFAKDKKLFAKWLALSATIRESSLLITSEEVFEEAQVDHILAAKDVMLALCEASKVYAEAALETQNDLVDGRQMGSAVIDPTSDIAQHVFIGADVKIGAAVTIYPGCRILSGCEIEAGVTLYANVTLYPGSKIGARSIIHAGSVIGADGFGYHFAGGIHHKIYHVGNVVIGEDVEIGANSCVDRATFGSTVIGDGSKIDNHVQIAHNCKLGRAVILCGHVAIGGSCVIGDYTVFGGKAATGHGLKIGRGVQVGGGGLVNCDWPDGSVITGYPARNVKEVMRGLAYVRKESLKKK